jgi:hypothetical protein
MTAVVPSNAEQPINEKAPPDGGAFSVRMTNARLLKLAALFYDHCFRAVSLQLGMIDPISGSQKDQLAQSNARGSGPN